MLNHKLSFENRHCVYKADNIDEAYDNFFDVSRKHYNTSCPIAKVIHKNEKPNKPWFTQGLRNACINKNKLYAKFLKYHTS